MKMEARDELYMLIAEARAVVLAASADDNFMTLPQEDLSCLFHLLLRQTDRMRAAIDNA